MKQLDELAKLNLGSVARTEVESMLQSLLEQAEQDARQLQIKDNEIQQKDFKIQALTHELAQIRYGVKNESLAPLQRNMFEDSWHSDQAAIEAEIE